MNRNGRNIFTGLLGFLSHDKWAELAFVFSLAWVGASVYVCWVNYQSTYIGIHTLFPSLAIAVIVAFVIFIQGSEIIVPILEGLDLHSEVASEFKLGFQVAWIVAVVVDYVTAWIWFNLQANITLETVAARFSQEPVRMVLVEFVILVFSLIFLVAEVLAVVGIRALIDRGKVILRKFNVFTNQFSPTLETREYSSPLMATAREQIRPSMMPSTSLSAEEGIQILHEVEEEIDQRPRMGFLQNNLPPELQDHPEGWRVTDYKSKPGSFIIHPPGGTPKAWSQGDPVPW